MTSPLAQVWTYTYDANSNLKTTIDANGNATQTADDGTTTYGYDRAGRLASIDYSDPTPDVSFAYDAAGNRTSMTDGAGTATRTYDSVNRLTGVTRGSDAFSYAYDAAGNLTRRTYPDGTVVDYGYDDDSRLVSVASGGQTTGYGYDQAGNVTQSTLPASNGYVETRIYDRAGRLVNIKNAKTGAVLSEFASTLDPVGNPIQVVRTGATASTTTYTYDMNDRLTGVCFQTSCPGGSDPFIRWTYDNVGNRLTEARPSGATTYTYNAADQLTQAGPTSFSYDQNGNQTAAGSRTFSYDLANRLGSTTSGGTTTTYSYDGDNNRLQASAGGQVTKFLWDTNHELPQLALERDGAGSLLRRYAYGTKRVSLSTTASSSYYHYDGIGSVANLTSATGASQWTYDYEAFGTARTETQDDVTAPANPMRFAGEPLDPTGLYHLRARQYQPASGRFLTLDPATRNEETPYSSSYVYAGDRPTVMVDPSGMTFQPSSSGDEAARQASSPVTSPASAAVSTLDASYSWSAGALAERVLQSLQQPIKLIYSAKVLAQQALAQRINDLGHSFPFWVDKYVVGSGNLAQKASRDPKAKPFYQFELEGSVKGAAAGGTKVGCYEIGGNFTQLRSVMFVTHRFFNMRRPRC